MLALEMLSEPVAIADTYVTELASIEDAGNGNVRLIFATRQRSPYGGDEHVIKTRLIMPLDAVYSAVTDTMNFAGLACCGAHSIKNRH